ncbi:MAG: SDR family NAD(P)-dependent oxidoreductase [Rhodospirillaceae bacterium]|nr:SDR family NAD(P)-dependent oxidoreductase [Rhodospirillaceae bacterium]
MFRLDGKVCLITGGAGHLGSAMSTALAEAGGHVCILGRTQGTLAKLANSLTDRGLSAEATTSDVTMAEDIRSLVADLRKRPWQARCPHQQRLRPAAQASCPTAGPATTWMRSRLRSRPRRSW